MAVTCPICGGGHPKWECKHGGVSGSTLPPFPGTTSNPAPETTSHPAPQTTSRPQMGGGKVIPGLGEAMKKLAPFPPEETVVLRTPGVTDRIPSARLSKKKRQQEAHQMAVEVKEAFDHRAGYNAYMREYMKKYRARKKEGQNDPT